MEKSGRGEEVQEAGLGQRSRDFYFWELFIWILFFMNILEFLEILEINCRINWICSFWQEAGGGPGDFWTSLLRTDIIIAGVRTHRD